MVTVFVFVFAVFGILEAILLIHFKCKKMNLEFHSTAVSFGVFLLFLLCVYEFQLRIPIYALYLTTAVLFVHSFFGYFMHLFNTSKIFDRWLHAFGTFSLALLVYFTLANFVGYGGSRAFRAMFILFLGITIGTVYEIIEFVTDNRAKLKGFDKLQRGLTDTDFDMISDCGGSLAAAVFAYLAVL